MRIVQQLAFRRSIERLHALGPQPLGHLLAEIAVEHDLADVVAAKLARYSHLDRETIKALGADRFPPDPLSVVPKEAA